MPAIQWTAFDPATGVALEPLPGLKLTSSLPKAISRSSGTVSVQLPARADLLPARWRLATRPWRAVIVAHYDDESAVLWAGLVQRRALGSGATVDLTLLDVEGWLAGQYLGDLTVTGDLAQIARQAVLAPMLSVFAGQTQVTSTGTVDTRRYKGRDDLTMLAALDDLADAQGGPEWTIDWQITDGVLSCRPAAALRLGRARTDLYAPVNLSRVEWTMTEDYGAGQGATTVTGTGSASGGNRIAVTRTTSSDLLPAEYRFQPDTTKVTTTAITGATEAKLAAIAGGTRTIDLKIPVTDERWVVGRDLQLGDDIQVDLANPNLPELNGTLYARVYGWVADADHKTGQITHITPVLYPEGG